MMNRLVLLTITITVSVYGEAPYPPSGWRPQGQPFTLPSRQQFRPEYGAPDHNRQPLNTQYLPNLEPVGTFAGNKFDRRIDRPTYETPNSDAQRPNIQYSSSFGPTRNAAGSTSPTEAPNQFTTLNRGPEPSSNYQNTNKNFQFDPEGSNQFQSFAQMGNFDRENPPNAGRSNGGFPKEQNTPGFSQGSSTNAQRPDTNAQNPNTQYASGFGPTRNAAGATSPTGVPNQFTTLNRGPEPSSYYQNTNKNFQFDPEKSNQFQNFAQMGNFDRENPPNVGRSDGGFSKEQNTPGFSQGSSTNAQRPYTNAQKPNTQYSSGFDPTRNAAGSTSPTEASNQFTTLNRGPEPSSNYQNANGNTQVDPEGSNQFPNFAQIGNFDRKNPPNAGRLSGGFPKQQNTAGFNQVENFNQGVVRTQKADDSEEDEPEEVLDDRPLAIQGKDFDDVNYSTPSRQYGAFRTTTEPQDKAPRRKPQRKTTPPPPTTTKEPDSEDSNQPNIAVSTAVATGQYYFLQPDGSLQRVVYMTSQKTDDDNGLTANLMYENIEPIRGPIFSYSDSPLVRLNK